MRYQLPRSHLTYDNGGKMRTATISIIAAIVAGGSLTACSYEASSEYRQLVDDRPTPTSTVGNCTALAGKLEAAANENAAMFIAQTDELSTFQAALKQADFVSSLERAPAMTIFAPTDAAFRKVPEARLSILLGDRDARIHTMAMHITAGRLSPENLTGAHQTLGGISTITVRNQNGRISINRSANLICGNIQTANATVYIIDSLLEEE